jgi:uncharacterized protein
LKRNPCKIALVHPADAQYTAQSTPVSKYFSQIPMLAATRGLATIQTMAEPLQLQSLPLFPLGTVLYPDGLLPLRIFEVRYLDMIGKCHKNGTPFGVVALTEGSEVRRVNASAPPSGDAFAHEAFNDVGTLATITALSRPQAGLILVQCLGTQRIRITQREKLKHGLWVANVDLLAPDTAVAIPPDLQTTAKGLGQIIHNLQTQGIAREQLPFGSPYRLDECGWVANRWCALLQLPLELKQRLMALDNPLVRLELVRDILDKMGIAP